MDVTQVRNQGQGTFAANGAGPISNGAGAAPKGKGRGGRQVFGLVAVSVAVLGGASSMAWGSVGGGAAKGGAATIEVAAGRLVAAPAFGDPVGAAGVPEELVEGATTSTAVEDDVPVVTVPEPEVAPSSSVPAVAEGALPAGGPDTPSSTAAATVPSSDRVVLRADAVGSVTFGTGVADTIDALTAMFGAPTEPLVWRDLAGTDETGLPYQAGYVSWGALTVQFFACDDVPVLSGWTLSSYDAVVNGPGADRFVTDGGLAAGMMVGEVQALRPDAAFEYNDVWEHFESHVEADGGYLWLSTLDAGPSAIVHWVSSGIITYA